MALYYTLPVYKATLNFIKTIFVYTQDFPREYKYTLGQDLKHDSMQLMRSIYRANKARDKRQYLEQFLDDFELVKLEIRLAAELKVLPISRQAELSEQMASIGKQITAWRNAGL